MNARKLSLLAAAALASATLAAAQAAPQSSPASRAAEPGTPAASGTPLGAVDQRVVALVNTANQGGIDTARLMEDRTQNRHVRDLAQELANDHQDAQNQLQDLAGKQDFSLTPDSSLQAQDRAQRDQLAGLSGGDADRAYVGDEIRDHRAVIRQLRQMEPAIGDPQLKHYVDSVIPVLQKHLDAAEKVQRELAGGVR